MTIYLQNTKEKYCKSREMIIEHVKKDPAKYGDINGLKKILCMEEQECLIRNIEPNNPEFFYQKNAALLCRIKKGFSNKKEANEYVRFNLENSTYNREEIQKIICMIKEKEQQGNLEEKVI